MSVSSIKPYQPYTGRIDTNSKRYKAAKAMYDEGHSGVKTRTPAEEKAERKLAELKALLRSLGMELPEGFEKNMRGMGEADEETFIRNYMGLFDEDGDFVNTYGVAGMDITGKDPSEWHNIIDVPEAARQDMFDETMRHFIQENGVANGDTTKRTEVFTRYQLSVKKSERLEGTWTLEQYERAYRQAFYDAVKEANPGWKQGQSFDTGLLRKITRESVESRLVQSGDTFTLIKPRSVDIRA